MADRYVFNPFTGKLDDAGFSSPVGVANGGTGTTTQFTPGSVVFAGTNGVYTQDNTNFFWDDANNRLGIGIASPSVQFQVKQDSGWANYVTTTGTTFSAEAVITASLTARSTQIPTAGFLNDSNWTITGGTTVSNLVMLGLNSISSIGATDNTTYNGGVARLQGGGYLASYNGTGSIIDVWGLGGTADRGSSGAVTNMTGGVFSITAGASASSGTVSNVIGVQIVRPTQIAGSTYTTVVGLDIQNQTPSAGTHPTVYAIRQQGTADFNSFASKFTTYSGVNTTGWGVTAIYGAGRSVGVNNTSVASVATYTVGTADGSFEVSANVNVTNSTTHNFTVTCAYTDESNTGRTLTLTFSLSGGTLLTAITNGLGGGPFTGLPQHIRCLANTSITIATTGAFVNVTYNVEGNIRQIA